MRKGNVYKDLMNGTKESRLVTNTSMCKYGHVFIDGKSYTANLIKTFKKALRKNCFI